jgi:RNA polymerase sigma factor (sigma-70 family)
VTLDQLDVESDVPVAELLALDDALTRLEEQDAERAQVVKLRFFAGLTEKETAEAMGISQRSAARLWAGARAWLYKEMEAG